MFRKRVAAVMFIVGVLSGSSAHSEQTNALMNHPVCYKNATKDIAVTLLGTHHFLPVAHRQHLLESLVDQSTIIFFENTGIYPENGVYGKPVVLSREDNPLVRLDSFINTQDLPSLAKLFGVPMSPETEVPFNLSLYFITAIFTKVLEIKGQSNEEISPEWEKLAGRKTFETAIYAYALQKKEIQIHDLESINEVLGIAESEGIKKEIGMAIECVEHAACLSKRQEYSKLIADYSLRGGCNV